MQPRRLPAPIVILLMGASQVMSQQPRTTAGKELVNQPALNYGSRPLKDYIPCNFLPSDRSRFHAIFVKSGSIEIAAARLGVDLSGLTDAKRTVALSAVNNLASQSLVTPQNFAHNLATSLAGVKELDDADRKQIVDNTQAAIDYSNGVDAPDDIGCSESVLTYDEAKDIFGRRFANTYIAMQVTIRNLNAENEFLLHDIQIAVDTDAFYATRDKRLARGVAEIGQAFNPRNQVMRYLEGAASGMSAAATPLGNVAFQEATNGFGAFVPVIKGIFPDLTIAQVGRLDDLGFTAGSLTYVIPKSGAHTMVAFIPGKLFQNVLETSKSCGTQATQSPCSYKDFRGYSTRDLKAFQESVELLIAGVHVNEVNVQEPAITSFTCDSATKGTNVSMTCHVAGKNLQTLKSIKLSFATDSTEGAAISGAPAVDPTDPTKATVVFSGAGLASLTPGKSYDVSLVGTDGSQIKTSLTYLIPSGQN